MSKSYSRIFWGLVLIIIGVLMFLKQFGIIYFHWYSLWQLWPLLLVFWGVSLLPLKDPLKLIISVVFIAVTFFVLLQYGQEPYHWHHDIEWW